jgi:hypothetical protein
MEHLILLIGFTVLFHCLASFLSDVYTYFYNFNKNKKLLMLTVLWCKLI